MKTLFKCTTSYIFLITLFVTNIAHAQIWNTTDANGNVTTNTTTAPVVKNVVVGPLPPTAPTIPSNLYINSTGSSTSVTIDNNFGAAAPAPTTHYCGLDFSVASVPKYRLYTSTFPGCPSGFFHITPVTSGPGIHLSGSSITFSEASALCVNGSNGLAVGKYMFDGSIGTSSINVGYAMNMPTGYQLVNSGTSYFRDKVVIGTTNTSVPTSYYKLYVGGTAICEELVVKLQANWPDFVFAPNYKLMPLTEVKTYIAENKHLPNVPAASEVEENGVATGEMLTIQMKKIEELTLYLIQMEERIKELEAQNKALQK